MAGLVPHRAPRHLPRYRHPHPRREAVKHLHLPLPHLDLGVGRQTRQALLGDIGNSKVGRQPKTCQRPSPIRRWSAARLTCALPLPLFGVQTRYLRRWGVGNPADALGKVI